MKLSTPLWLCLYCYGASFSVAWSAQPGVNLIQSGATQTISGGASVALNCNHLTVQGILLVGSGNVRQANDVGITGTLNGGSGLLDVGGNWTNNGVFIEGSGTVDLSGECVAGPVLVTGNTNFCNLDLSGSGVNYVFPAGNATTVNCSLDLGSGNTLTTSTPGETAYIRLGPGATLTGDATQVQVVIVPYDPQPPNPIPTLGEYGLLALALLLAGIAARKMSFPSTDSPPSRRA